MSHAPNAGKTGLGKTLVISALLLNDLPAATAAAESAASAAAAASPHAVPPPKPLVPTRATLVVVLTSLVAQWVGELAKTTRAGALKVTVYPPPADSSGGGGGEEGEEGGEDAAEEAEEDEDEEAGEFGGCGAARGRRRSDAPRGGGDDEAWHPGKRKRAGAGGGGGNGGGGGGGVKGVQRIVIADALSALSDHDVVITTYAALAAEAPGGRRKAAPNKRGGNGAGSGGCAAIAAQLASARCLSRLAWRRVVVDECQEVRGGSTAGVARAAAALCATKARWMVSGTPLFSGVDDLHGELLFLSVWPFSLTNDGFWEAKSVQHTRDPPSSHHLLLHSHSLSQPFHRRSQQAVGAERPAGAVPRAPPVVRHRAAARKVAAVRLADWAAHHVPAAGGAHPAARGPAAGGARRVRRVLHRSAGGGGACDRHIGVV